MRIKLGGIMKSLILIVLSLFSFANLLSNERVEDDFKRMCLKKNCSKLGQLSKGIACLSASLLLLYLTCCAEEWCHKNYESSNNWFDHALNSVASEIESFGLSKNANGPKIMTGISVSILALVSGAILGKSGIDKVLKAFKNIKNGDNSTRRLISGKIWVKF